MSSESTPTATQAPEQTPRSSASLDSFSSGRRSPTIHEYDSTAALIVVPEHDDLDIEHEDPEEPATPFELFSSDDDSQDGDDTQLDRASRGLYSSIPPLSSTTIFLYLLSPLLKLGALLSSSLGLEELPLRICLPALFFFASLCALTRQIWYMLARYVKRTELEEILLQAFARRTGRGHEGERRRQLITNVVRSCTGLMRVLLVAVYLRASADIVLAVLPTHFISSRVAVTLFFALAVSPLFLGASTSLGSTTVLYATWISVLSYIAWVAGAAYAHAKGISIPIQGILNAEGSLGSLWQGLSIIAFTYATSSTLPLYSAIRRSGLYHESPGSLKPKRSRAFRLLSFSSIAFATALIIPPMVFELNDASPFRSQANPPPPDSPLAEGSLSFKGFMASLSAMTLVLGIPSVIVTTPTIPIPFSIRRFANHTSVSRLALHLVASALALMPSVVSCITSDVLMLIAFLSTFTIPAFIHIVIHNFRRPLSIVIPPSTPTNTVPLQRSTDSYHDELLQRKERTLQRRRLARRLFWDISVWVLLLPVGGGGLAWAVGRVLGRW